MSTAPAVTMRDLELEHAELLPRRETLIMHYSQPAVSLTNLVTGNGNGNGNGNGHVNQLGFANGAFGTGNGDGNGNGGTTIFG